MTKNERNDLLVNALKKVVSNRSITVHPGRSADGHPDYDTGIVTVYANEIQKDTLIDIIKVLHKLKRDFKLSSWGESKWPCLQTVD